MKKELNVILLATDKSDLILFEDNNTLKYAKGEQRYSYAENSPQYLYILLVMKK